VWKGEEKVVDSQPFLIDSFINTVTPVSTFIDSGCLSYCVVDENFSRTHDFRRNPIRPRDLQLATKDETTQQIREIATFDLDIDGWTHEVHGYVIPDLAYPVILGKPWMEQHDIVYHAKDRCLTVSKTGQLIKEKGWHEDPRFHAQRTARLAIPQVMHAAVRKARQRKQSGLQVFATSLHDINQALAPKAKLTLDEVTAQLPDELKDVARLFCDEGNTQLPLNRRNLDHAINLKKDEQGREVPAPWGPLYGMSREELLVLRKTLTEHMAKGWIRASSSSASAPVLFVRKPNGDLRFCCDYRAINALTTQDRYPLPLIKETLRDIGEADWYTKVDIRSAFHRLRIREGDEWKTAFRTRFGLFEWLVTPFGLAGAPASFQRFINHILRDRLGIDVTAYMDDILVYTKGSREDHMKVVREVIGKLEQEDLRLDLKKSAFGVEEIAYLGFVVTAGVGVSMDPAKIKAILKWETPTNVRDVRGFVGFANFYRAFIEKFSEKTMPLTMLTKKDVAFTWGLDEQKAFEDLKTAFTTAPILAHFDPELDTVVEPDGSGWSLGSCLSQWHDGVLRPVAYLSAKFAPAEVNYDIHDKELLGIVRSLEEWRPELTGVARPFMILTDHKNLEYFMTTKKLSERQVRWSELLSRFNFTLTHRPGKLNGRADALSRLSSDIPTASDERITNRERTLIQPEWVHVAPTVTFPRPQGQTLFTEPDLARLWNEGLRQDEVLKSAYKELRQGDRVFSTARAHLGAQLGTPQDRIDPTRAPCARNFGTPRTRGHTRDPEPTILLATNGPGGPTVLPKLRPMRPNQDLAGGQERTPETSPCAGPLLHRPVHRLHHRSPSRATGRQPLPHGNHGPADEEGVTRGHADNERGRLCGAFPQLLVATSRLSKDTDVRQGW
jgi:hypothetical protein